MRNLEIFPNYLDFEESSTKSLDEIMIMDLVLKNKKSHLFSLLPLLSEYITTREGEVKQIVKEIFRIISAEMGIR